MVNGVDVNKIYNDGGSAFTLVTWDAMTNMAKFIYQTATIHINRYGAIGETPLTGCALYDLTDMAQFLVSLPSIKVNKPSKASKETPFQIAIRQHSIGTILTLLESNDLQFDSLEIISLLCGQYKISSSSLTSIFILSYLYDKKEVNEDIISPDIIIKKAFNNKNFDRTHMKQYLQECKLNKIYDEANDFATKRTAKVFLALYDCFSSLTKQEQEKTDVDLDAFKIYGYKISDPQIFKKLFFQNGNELDIDELKRIEKIVGKSPLYYAIKDCPDTLSLDFLLMNPKINPNAKIKGEKSIIIVASEMKKNDFIEKLINDKRIEIDFTDFEYILNDLPETIIKQIISTARLKIRSLKIINDTTLIKQSLSLLISTFNKGSYVNFDISTSDTGNQNQYECPLKYAIIKNDIKLFNLIISQVPDINMKINNICLLIIKHWKSNILKELLKFYENTSKNFVNHADSNGFTPLIYATYTNKIDFIHVLLSCPYIDVDKITINKKGLKMSALSCAQNLDTALILINNKAREINLVNPDGHTILYKSIKLLDSEFFHFILAQPFCNIFEQFNQYSPIFYRSMKNSFHFDTIKKLEIPPDSKTINFFIQHNNIKNLIKCLNYYEMKGKTIDGFLPLEKANEETLQILLYDKRNIIDFSSPNYSGNNKDYCLLRAVKNNDISLINRLFEVDNKQDLQVNWISNQGKFALGEALFNNRNEIAVSILHHPKCNVNLLYKDLYSPLYLAVRNNNPSLVQLILKKSTLMLNHESFNDFDTFFKLKTKTNKNCNSYNINSRVHDGILCPLALAIENNSNISIIEMLINTSQLEITKSIILTCFKKNSVSILQKILNNSKLYSPCIQVISESLEFILNYNDANSLLEFLLTVKDINFNSPAFVKNILKNIDKVRTHILNVLVNEKFDYNQIKILTLIVKSNINNIIPFYTILPRVPDINKFYKGETFLMYCIKHHHFQAIYSIICDKRVDLSLKSDIGKNAFDIANENSFFDLAHLIEYHSKLNNK